MLLTLEIFIFLESIFELLPTVAQTQSNTTVSHPNGSLVGNEMWMMGIIVKTDEEQVYHYCLGINIWHTGKILTACSCLAKAHEGRVFPYTASWTTIYWNPAYLGWGENPVYSQKLQLSARCKPRKLLPLPWSSDLAILDTHSFVDPSDYARHIDVNLPPPRCTENDEPLFEKTFSSWRPKMCTEELYWTIRQAQLGNERCSTYITEGEFNKLVLREVHIIPWRDCDRLICDSYPDLCDLSSKLIGILCTTHPSSNSCLPVGSPLICNQAVLGLYSRPHGSKWTCNQTIPVLMYTSLARVTSAYHDFLSPKDKSLICESFRKCAQSRCAVILPLSVVVMTILTFSTNY